MWILALIAEQIKINDQQDKRQFFKEKKIVDVKIIAKKVTVKFLTFQMVFLKNFKNIKKQAKRKECNKYIFFLCCLFQNS